MKIKRVYLEITDSCNLDCPFCTNKKGHSFMSMDEINSYLTQIKEISDYVYLHVLGEPLLHKNIHEILKKCDELNLYVQLVTNGTLLKNNRNIYEYSSLRKLSISLHSMNDTKIENEYFEEIKKLIEINRHFDLELRFYSFNNLNGELKNFYNFLVDKYGIKNTTKNNSYKLNNNTYVYLQDLFKWPNINDNDLSEIGYCHGGLDQIAILHNGDVTICCLDPLGHNKIGNLKEKSLIEILNDKPYNDYLINIKKRKLIFNLCKKCSYRLRFDDKHN